MGLTSLEADVFAFLLTGSPATGYRVARALGKPAANTYKAIESLEGKGAILVEEGPSRLCRAVPVHEFLAAMERRFKEHHTRVARALGDLEAPADDDRVYKMRSRPQVLERCRSMLHRGRQVVLLDIFPKPLEALRADIEGTASRGVNVVMKAYKPATLKGVEVVYPSGGEEIIQRWPGHWLNVVVDGREHLLSLLSPEGEGVHQAVWSGSPYLSWIYHRAICSEIIQTSMEGMMEQGAPIEQIRKVFARFRQIMASAVPTSA
jgi:hypothetical protein